MAFQLQDRGPIDPAVTANFLGCLDNVVSAQAWMKGEAILAKVTVTQDARITELDLLHACMATIGEQYTPRAIWLDRRVRPAA